IDRIDDPAAVRAQHASLVGHFDSRDALAQPVHRGRCLAAEQAVLPLQPDRADVVMAVAHFLDQLADFLRRVLQVRIERDYDVATGLLEAGQDRHVLPIVAIKQHDAGGVRACLVLLGQQRGRVVAAAVVDENHFVGQIQCIERRIEPRGQRGQARLLVVGRDDFIDGLHDARHVGHRHLREQRQGDDRSADAFRVREHSRAEAALPVDRRVVHAGADAARLHPRHEAGALDREPLERQHDLEHMPV
ncbi:hypothetical protein DFQ30_004806, partial [Apophysomyces sp. BC1015]